MFKHFFLLIFFFILPISESVAEYMDYYNFKCLGVLRAKNINSVAHWDINFINTNRATLDLFYNNKKRSADLRISIQNNLDFHGNGKWRNQTAQGGRFVRLNYIDSSKKLLLRGLNAIFRVEGKCKKTKTKLQVNKKTSTLKNLKEIIFIIKEHSKYSLNHPSDKENVIRHLKHTCHAINSNLVKERPMPASENSLVDILGNVAKFDNKYLNIINNINVVAHIAKNNCRDYLYSKNNISELLETANYIYSNFETFYNELANK